MNLIDLKPYNQKILLGYDNLFLNIVNLWKNKKLANKIFFSGSKGIGKATFAYHLINYIFSNKEQFPYDINNYKINNSNKSFNLVKNNSHPNFHLIDLFDDKKVIEIAQIRKMINYANKSAFNNKERIILIDNAENLNLNSSNALLKIVEEPNDNVLFILIFDNNKKILETVKSRCLKFNFILSSNECIDITSKIIQKNLKDIVNIDLISHYSTVGDFINLINFSLTSNLDVSNADLKNLLLNIIENKHYKKDIYIKNNVYKFIEFYFLKLINLNNSHKKIFLLYENFIKKIFYLKKFNLDEETFFIEFKNKILNE
jgi:DNA polymerase-3 subunit delta'|tara:strand:+ start:5094 stop:6041 length:948 start_codon:yes stop_codon:yes gene_type:complete